ncbi:hypothetical protein C834K_0412 [Chlamydia poikilotherma]|uniref:Uncharacterized protein n=1 Tax=Chlamydia poikilotherma TaxID=1967783 RepID=A0A3B0PNX9_9CHLA|nr:hypothetical protein [Chlamydia poikilotherma]SYX08873.1 hypothetical protein C834K_0412 [Chlamydia poikilotherma]
MTSPIGRGNTNPSFIFDNGSSNTGGNSTNEIGRGAQHLGGVRRAAANIYGWFQQGGGGSTSMPRSIRSPVPTQPVSGISAPQVSAPTSGVDPGVQALLNLLMQHTGPAVTTQPVSGISAPQVSAPTSGVDPGVQALLNLLMQHTGPAVTTQPVSGIGAPQVSAPTSGVDPGVQALLNLLMQHTGPAVTTQPFSTGNQTPQMLQALLNLFVQGSGGVSGQGSQMLISLLQSITSTYGPYQQGFGALANLVSGQGTTSSSIGTAVQALSGLASLAGPAGTAVGSLASILAAAATSESARRGGRFCYDNCHTCCEGNCCCPRCGCSDGQCGCGSLGRCLCGLFGNCCGVQVDSRRALEEELQEIENEFGDSIFLIALSNLGMDTVGLLSGSTAITLPDMGGIREECRNCSRDLPGILKNKTNAMWGTASQDYSKILQNTFLRGSLVSGMASFCDINTNQLKDCVRILYKWGGNGGVTAASYFDMEKLALTLPDLTVTSRHNSAVGPLGVITAANVMQDLGKVLMKASHGGRQIWIDVSELMTLVCMILAYRGICVVSDATTSEGARIYEVGEMQQFFRDVDNCRLMNERNRAPAPYVSSVNPYADLAARCFAEHGQRTERMRNPGDASRQQLLTNLSSRWMLAAGITSMTPVTTQSPALTAPIITRAQVSRLGGISSTVGGQNERDYYQEGARPRIGNGTNQRGNSQGQGDRGNNNEGMKETRV